MAEEKSESAEPLQNQPGDNQSAENTTGEQRTDIEQNQAAAEINRDARMWAMFCHLAGLAGYLIPAIGNIIGPLIVWLVKREEDPFIDGQGKEAVNFQISMTIYALISAALIPLFCIGGFLLIAVGIVDLILLIVAAIKANNGEPYRYPIAIRFIK